MNILTVNLLFSTFIFWVAAIYLLIRGSALCRPKQFQLDIAARDRYVVTMVRHMVAYGHNSPIVR